MLTALIFVIMSMLGDFLEQRAMRWALPIHYVLTNNTFTVLSLIIFFFGKPLDKLTAVPKSLALYVVELVSDVSYPILLAIAPWASIGFGAELPNISTLTVSLIIFKITTVLS